MPVRKLRAAPSRSAKKTSPKGTKKAKRPGDVLGLSGARVPKTASRATSDRGGNPRGIEVGPLTKRRKPLPKSRVRN